MKKQLYIFWKWIDGVANGIVYISYLLGSLLSHLYSIARDWIEEDRVRNRFTSFQMQMSQTYNREDLLQWEGILEQVFWFYVKVNYFLWESRNQNCEGRKMERKRRISFSSWGDRLKYH